MWCTPKQTEAAAVQVEVYKEEGGSNPYGRMGEVPWKGMFVTEWGRLPSPEEIKWATKKKKNGGIKKMPAFWERMAADGSIDPALLLDFVLDTPQQPSHAPAVEVPAAPVNRRSRRQRGVVVEAPVTAEADEVPAAPPAAPVNKRSRRQRDVVNIVGGGTGDSRSGRDGDRGGGWKKAGAEGKEAG